MTICYFGNYDPDYARNRVILKGLQANECVVMECRSSKKGLSLFKDLVAQHKPLQGNYDLMIVGYSDNRLMVPLAKLIARTPIIWDAFYSLYDSWVFDRKLVERNSLKAKLYWFLDWLNCVLAKAVLIDTQTHAEYFIKTFRVPKHKMKHILVGSDTEVMYPREVRNSDTFLVHFHGKFIPLQGITYIIDAAKELASDTSTQFRIIGSDRYDDIRKQADGLSNIEFIGKVSYDELAERMSEADCCLGVFGTTAKAQRVIPNKVYEAIALKKAIITADTPAARELFTDKHNAVLCKAGNGKSIAESIVYLKNNQDKAEQIAQAGYKLFLEKAQPEIIGKDLTSFLRQYVH